MGIVACDQITAVLTVVTKSHLVIGGVLALAVAWLSIFGPSSRSLGVIAVVHSAAGHAGLVADTRVMRGTGSCHFSVASTLASLVPLPERLARAFCVVVGWRRSITLLFLVVADEKEIKTGADKEREETQDSHSEASSIEAASITIIASSRGCFIIEAGTDRGVDDAAAFVRTMTRVVCNRCEAASKGNIKDDAQEPEDGVATEEESEEYAEYGV